MAKRIVALLLAIGALFCRPPVGRADSAPPGEAGVYDTFTVYWENDLLFGSDGRYTNGVRFTWSTPYRPDSETSRLPQWSQPWFRRLTDGPDTAQAVALSLGQSIYTPAKINSAQPDPNDRPYAGYSYLAAAFHYREATVKTTWELQAGVVGPLSLAEETQDFFHHVSAINNAKGWDHQLKNEPALQIFGERHWLLLHAARDRGLSFDLVPHLGGQFGNVAILANGGGELRWGWRLPRQFGTCTIRGGCENNSAFAADQPGAEPVLHNWYLFTAVDGRWVIRDIFLDGNTCRESPSVEKEPLVADLMAGISVQFWVLRATCAYVHRTREFKSQDDPEIFGTMSLSWSY